MAHANCQIMLIGYSDEDTMCMLYLPMKTFMKPPRMRTRRPVYKAAPMLEKSRLVWTRIVLKSKHTTLYFLQIWIKSLLSKINLEGEGSQANNHSSSKEECLVGNPNVIQTNIVFHSFFLRIYSLEDLIFEANMLHLDNNSLVEEGDQNTDSVRLDGFWKF